MALVFVFQFHTAQGFLISTDHMMSCVCSQAWWMLSDKSHTKLDRAASKARVPLNPNLAQVVFLKSHTCLRDFSNVINTVNHRVTYDDMYAVKQAS